MASRAGNVDPRPLIGRTQAFELPAWRATSQPLRRLAERFIPPSAEGPPAMTLSRRFVLSAALITAVAPGVQAAQSHQSMIDRATATLQDMRQIGRAHV